MSLVLTISILLRIAAMVIAMRAWVRLRNGWMLVFAGVIGLTGVRQMLTLLKQPELWPPVLNLSVTDEAVGLTVSVGFVTAAFGLERLLSTVRRQAEQLKQQVTDVTRSAATLRESETRFRDFSRSFGDWFWETDAEHRFTWFNAEADRLAGAASNDAFGHRRWELPGVVGGADAPEWLEHRAKLQARLPFKGFRYRWRYPDGRIHWLESNGVPFSGPDGEFLGYRGTGRDVTGLMEAETELRTISDRFKGLVEGSLQGTFVVQDTRVVFANEAACQLFGYTREELLALPSTESLYPPEEWAFISDRLRRRTAGEAVPERYEYRGLKQDGTVIWIETRARRVEWSGRPAVQANLIDVTEQRRAEEDLRASRRLLQGVFDALPSWVLVRDRELKIMLVNRAVSEGYGVPIEAMIGQTLHTLDFGLPEERARIDAVNREVLSTGRVVETAAHPLTMRDGQRRYWDTVRVPLTDDDGQVIGVIGVADDVTEAHMLRQQLFTAQRMEALGRLAGGVAHDFNNLLAVILGYSEFLKEELQGQERAMRDIEEVHKAGERGAALTRQLLAFSRRQVQKLESLAIAELLEGMTRMLERLIGEDIRLVMEAEPQLGLVVADAIQIEQVVLNLVLNARDAMPRGGSITVRARNVSLEPGDAPLRQDMPPGPYVLLAVTDQGEGISEQVQRQIFEPFFTTKSIGEGTGLGLATVYGIVQQSRGTIVIDSEAGRGTTFNVYLPRAGEPQTLPPHPAEEVPHPEGGGAVLLVEDEQGVREATARMLRNAGYAVLEAEDGETALRLAGEHSGAIDLMLTDVVMPGMSGPVLADRLRQVRPGLNVLYMSGYTDDAIDHHGRFDSGENFLEKPFTRKTLLGTVYKLIHPDAGGQD